MLEMLSTRARHSRVFPTHGHPALDSAMPQSAPRGLGWVADAAHSVALTPSTRAALLLGAAGAVVLLWLWAKVRYQRRRLSRAFTRSLSHGTSRKQLKSLRKHKVMARAGRARRTAFRLRLAVFLSVLLFAAWAYSQIHPHTH